MVSALLTLISRVGPHQRLSSKAAFAPTPVPAKKPCLPKTAAMGARQPIVLAASSASVYTVIVQGRQLQVTPAIKEYAETKVNKALHNFEGSVKEVDVKLSATGGKGSEAHHQRNQTVEVTVYTLRHGVIRVEDTEDDLYAALDLVTDKLKRKMVRMKEKATLKNTWPGRGSAKGGDTITNHIDPESSDEDLPLDAVAPVPGPEIVREKILILDSTMSPEDAVDQLEAVGHDFFIFKDKADGALKVVYRRRTHGYGLLIPQ